MKVQTASSLVFGALSIALVASSGARAAVTVLGPGPAQECYHDAEYGGDAREALATCSFALDGALSVADRAATFVNRGVIRLSLHQNDEALADIDSGIALVADLGDGYVDRGAALMALGRYDDAMADLNKGIQLGPHRPQVAFYDRAIIFERNGDIRAAYEDYKKALDVAPNFTPAADELKRFRVVRKDSGA